MSKLNLDEIISVQNIIEEYMREAQFIWGSFARFKRDIFNTLVIYTPRPEEFDVRFEKYKDQILMKKLAKRIKIKQINRF